MRVIALIDDHHCEEVAELAASPRSTGVAAMGVVCLNAYSNPANEEDVANWLRDRLPGAFITHTTGESVMWGTRASRCWVAGNQQLAAACRRAAHQRAARGHQPEPSVYTTPVVTKV
ncbi:MAG: hypothetical protein WCE38_13495 [Burkholderiales bacterium]